MAVSELRGKRHGLAEIEIQGTTEIDWTAQIEVDVPQSIIDADDPDALSDWADKNITDARIDDVKTSLSEQMNRQGADFVS